MLSPNKKTTIRNLAVVALLYAPCLFAADENNDSGIGGTGHNDAAAPISDIFELPQLPPALDAPTVNLPPSLGQELPNTDVITIEPPPTATGVAGPTGN